MSQYIHDQIFQSMQYILSAPITSDLGIFFFVDRNGTQKELVPKGNEIAVTEENKEQFTKLMVEYISYTEVKDEVAAFKEGFLSLIPIQTLEYFEPEDLFSMMNGANFINIEDWYANTCYESPYSVSHNIIKDYWKMIGKMNDMQREKILQFVTGSTCVPIGGFKYLESNRGQISKFTIISTQYSKGKLPSAHTCFNRLVLPQYPTITSMVDAFNKCIEFALVGFGLE
jgi:HECT-domain (ubiquitin-transferase)